MKAIIAYAYTIERVDKDKQPVDYNEAIIGRMPEGRIQDAKKKGMELLVDVDLSSYKASEYQAVKTLHIDEHVYRVSGFRDTLFPNLERVVSRSPYFASGGCLSYVNAECGGTTTLVSALRRANGEALDLSGVSTILGHAFDGTTGVEVTNTESVQSCHAKAESLTPSMREKYTKPDNSIQIGVIYMAAPQGAKRVTIPADAACVAIGAFDGAAAKEIFLEDATTEKIEKLAANMPGSIDTLTLGVGPDSEIDFCKIAKKLMGRRVGSVEVFGESKRYKSVDGAVYSKDGTKLLLYPNGREGTAFVENGTKKIGKRAFLGAGITGVILPEGLERIGYSAFRYCKIRAIELPKSVNEIGEGNFAYAQSVKAAGPIRGLMHSLGVIYPNGDEKHVAMPPYVRMEIAGHKFIMPCAVTSRAKFFFEQCDYFGKLIPKNADKMYQYAMLDKMRDECAIAQYALTPENEELRKEARTAAYRVAKRAVEGCNERAFLDALRTGLLDKGWLVHAVDEVGEKGTALMKAALLEAIGKAEKGNAKT